MGKIGIWELMVVLAILLLIIGPKALPKLGESLGKTIGNFKKGLEDDNEKKKDENSSAVESDKED